MTDIKHTKAFYNTEIPSEWDVKSLKQLTKKIGSGITPSGGEKVYQKAGRPFLRSQNVGWGILLLKDVVFIDENTHSSFLSTELIENDVLLNITGASIGRCAIATKQVIGGNVNQHVCIIRSEKDLLLPNFLNAFILSTIGQNLIDSFQAGGNRQGLNFEQIRSFKIPLPPLPEQRAIAQVLSTADAAIHTTEKLIAQKELRKKWLMQQLLTGKKRLKGFEGEWKECSFDKLLKVVKRPVKWDDNKLYKLISVRRRSCGIFFREALYGHQIKVKDLRDVEVGDFLFSKMQIVHGASALVTKEFEGSKISGSYIATVAKDSKLLNMEFFNWYSKLPYFYHQALISSYGVHIEKMTFDFDTFLQLEMKLPSIEEQTTIAQVLHAADKEISLLKAKAERLREQKRGLMQLLLTGKKRLIF
jgi:type I restriction enzyme, S subunit